MANGVLIGISGGVDSAVAAAILQERGYWVEGLYLRNGFPVGNEKDAVAVADRLGFPLHILDITESFRSDIVDYFVNEYLTGRTPNPCIVCNKRIKFRYLLEEAHARRLNFIATGHYARVQGGEGGPCLLKGTDTNKDQAYFLFQLGQEELRRLMLPNGDRTKEEIQGMARALRLPCGRENQEICFIPDDNYHHFLKNYLVTLPSPGNIVDREGNILGRHRGIHTVTIGQRRGLNIASSRPYYVLGINTERDEIIVGREEDQHADGLIATHCSWINATPAVGEILQARVYIRYRHKGVDAEITHLTGGRAQVSFRTPQKAVAPGQAAVFYRGDLILGGGWIERGLRDV